MTVKSFVESEVIYESGFNNTFTETP